ncbi:hypothetical protein J512_2588, partial [Acinetobacter baumannii 1295743]
MAIASTTHTTFKIMMLEKCLPFMTGVLAAL